MARHKYRYRIGDIIVATESSNHEYNFTTERNGCVAKVTDVDYGSEEDIKIVVTKLTKNTHWIGEDCWVNSNYFAPIKDNSTTKQLLEGKN